MTSTGRFVCLNIVINSLCYSTIILFPLSGPPDYGSFSDVSPPLPSSTKSETLLDSSSGTQSSSIIPTEGGGASGTLLLSILLGYSIDV